MKVNDFNNTYPIAYNLSMKLFNLKDKSELTGTDLEDIEDILLKYLEICECFNLLFEEEEND